MTMEKRTYTEFYCRSMATEIPEGWANWKAQRNGVMVRIQPSSVVAETYRNPFYLPTDIHNAEKRRVIKTF